VGPLGGGVRDLRTPTINKKCRWWAPYAAVPEIQKRSPSTLRNIDCGTLGGDDEDPGAPTINDRNIDGGPPGRR
jgi:hypothetical protein